MDPKDIEQLRYNVLTNAAKMPALITFRNNNIPDYQSDIEHLNDLETVIGQLETIYGMGPKMAFTILGKEFQANIVPHSKVLAVPLYLYLDMIEATVKQAMNNTAKLDRRKQLLLVQLKECRRKAAKLPHHPDFNPKKHLSKVAIENMIASKGNYHFSRTVINGSRYITIVSAVPSPSKEKDKDPYVYHEDLAFQEDYNQIKISESERYINYIREMQNHIKKYFVKDRIPDSPSSFHATLKDPHLDENIRVNLLAIIEQIGHNNVSESSIPLDQAYSQLLMHEELLQKQQVEEKATAYAEETLDEQKGNQNKGVFKRYMGQIQPRTKEQCAPQDILVFEEERKKQILLDEEKRNIVIYKRKEIHKKMSKLPLGTKYYRRP